MLCHPLDMLSVDTGRPRFARRVLEQQGDG
jgi:hypothetical protein